MQSDFQMKISVLATSLTIILFESFARGNNRCWPEAGGCGGTSNFINYTDIFCQMEQYRLFVVAMSVELYNTVLNKLDCVTCDFCKGPCRYTDDPTIFYNNCLNECKGVNCPDKCWTSCKLWIDGCPQPLNLQK